MVEFGLKLAENMVERWRREYIDYKALKKLLKRLRDQERRAALPSALSWVTFGRVPSTSSLRDLDSPSRTPTPQPGEDTPLLSRRLPLHRAKIEEPGEEEDGDNEAETSPAGLQMRMQLSEEFEVALRLQIGKVERFYRNTVQDLAEEYGKLCMLFRAVYRFRPAAYDLQRRPGGSIQAMLDGQSEPEQLLERRVGDDGEALLGDLEAGESSGGEHVAASLSASRASGEETPARGGSWNVSRLGFTSESDNGVGSRREGAAEEQARRSTGRRRRRKRAAGMLLAQSEEVQSSVQQGFTELTREAVLLQNYCILNYTACVKILKKHDKLFPDSALQEPMLREIEAHKFYGHHGIDRLVQDIEGLVADLFCDGNRAHARGMLLTKRGTSKPDWDMLHLGYRLGVAAVLFFWTAWDCAVQVLNSWGDTVFTLPAFPVYRAVGGLLLLHWAWGLSVLVWTRSRINYIYLFDLDPRHVRKPRQIFASATDEAIVYFINLLLYYKVKMRRFPAWIPAGYYPLSLCVYALYKLVTPWERRQVLWSAVMRCLAAPFRPVTFLDSYAADVLTSMVKVFQDIAWSVCYFISGQFLLDSSDVYQRSKLYRRVIIPIICILGVWVRFQQCLRRFYDTRNRWPHLANAGKYALSQFVSLFGALYPLYNITIERHLGRALDTYQLFWIGAFVMSALYSFCWDVFVDWNLGRPQYGFLGPSEKLMFSRRWCYYLAIVGDLFLRFLWVTTLVPPDAGNSINMVVPAYVGPAVMMGEIMRRTIWSMFRLENEHQRNTSGYRRVHFVPLLFDSEKKAPSDDGRQARYTGWGILMEVVGVFSVVVAILLATVLSEAISQTTASSEFTDDDVDDDA